MICWRLRYKLYKQQIEIVEWISFFENAMEYLNKKITESKKGLERASDGLWIYLDNLISYWHTYNTSS